MSKRIEDQRRASGDLPARGRPDEPGDAHRVETPPSTGVAPRLSAFPDGVRDYLAEARAIIRGETMLLAERQHLIALAEAMAKEPVGKLNSATLLGEGGAS